MDTPLDILWVLLSGALVMLMQLGFCMLESGLVRTKNTINVAAKNLVDFCVAVIAYWAIGYGLMFGAGSTGWFGENEFFFEVSTGFSEGVFFFFQLVFCATAATIIAGAVAERMRFSGYLIISILVTAVIYPISGHWIWGGDGWLANLGFIDFAGSTVVHSVGGWLALASVIVIGPRIGRFSTERSLASGHSLVQATFGVLILWFGWIGFNGGSTLAFDASVPGIIFNTFLAASAGGLMILSLSRARTRIFDLKEMLNGVVAGLVAITACAPYVSEIESIIIGVVGGVLSYYGSVLLGKLRVDDVVGASCAHGFPGVWGTLAVAIFGDLSILGTGLTRSEQFGVQALGVGAVFVWTFVLGGLLIYGINRVFPLRIGEREEREGLNVCEHGASTEILDLLGDMRRQRERGDFSSQVPFDPYTEVGQIAHEYNGVLVRVAEEMTRREEMADKLAVEKEASEKVTRDLMSSISYAKRIQSAVFPDLSSLDLDIAGHFLIFEPREAVSGDFIWIHRNSTRLTAAVVDCTGHGVPGAFMSLIGHTFLNEIILGQKREMPDEILEELHRKVRSTLKQDQPGADAQDGMDVCIVRIDSSSVAFAGAKRPLMWIPATGPKAGKCQVLRGDRKSIGGRQREEQRTFSCEVIKREKGMKLYLSSDGLVEQTNENREPYDTSRFRRLLEKIHREDPEKQREAILKSLRDFQGSVRRKDDVAVLGLFL
ncbi:ammonium transporter [Puniceicoccus vermicola]|uniref:Ammonium transporter n=1 Tax=Puniceicoccus vermicola TaxID=388746 RepID=A0A7X1E2W6_9BACT|nr:ammonium transporter [Puniceicoccus vermicola]